MDDRPGLFASARVASRCTLLALAMLTFTACSGSKAVPPLTMTPATATIDSGATESMRATGGLAPYRYAVVSGAGSIDATTGVYTAPQAATTALVSVTDNAGASAKATLTVNAPLATATLALSVFPGSSQMIAVAGGEAPYVFSIVSGPGSIDPASGRYTASTGGSATIKITDALGSSLEVTITANRVYQQPTAVDDLVSFSAGSNVVVNVLANDLDPDGGPLTVSIIEAPTVGTATVQADGTVQLSLPAGFRGFTRFSYAIANGGGFTSMANAGVFVATAPLQLAWLGDDFTPGMQEIVVDNLLAPRRVNAPLTAGQSIGNAILRTDGTVPEAGYTVSTTASGVAATFAARLDGSTPPVVLPQATSVNALSGDGAWALVAQGSNPLQLATTDGSAMVPITAGPVCAGTFAGQSDNFVVECSQAAPTFLAPTYYEAAALTTLSYTQLSPALNNPSPPGVPTVSPDGATLVYLDSRTDGLGAYQGVFAVALSTPSAADTLVSPRLPALNAADWIVSFSAGSLQMLQAVFGASTGAGLSCDLWSVPLATPASLVQVSPASLSSGSCPRTGAYSPDGSKIVFIAPAQTNGLGGTGIYEVMLANPNAVQTLVAPVTGIYYNAVVYDETGTDLFLTSNLNGTNRNDLFEWHRGASSPFSQLNPVGLTSQNFTVTPDGAMIIWLANDPVAAPAWVAYLIDRSVPGQAWRLSSATATLGVSSGVSLILGH